MTGSLFTGLKVIDCASWIAGPAAATMLSDFGADVIKIEPPGAGDPWRASQPIPGKKVDYYWQLTSRNKRSLALDLKHPDGQAVLHRLVATADVFITNFPLPVRDRLRMAPADLTPLNPRLIYASFTAYGEAGEEAAKTGFDSTAYWARTGLMDMVRSDADTVPSRSMPGMGDFPSATGVYAAIVTALYRREKTGQGGVVRSSLLQNGLWANGCAVQTRLFGENVALRPHRDDAPNALANHYRSRDGRWFIMALFNEQRQLRSFLEAIGREDLTDDPRFATTDARKQHARELVIILDEVFSRRDLAEWRTILDGVGITFGIVATVNEALDDPQMRHAGALVPFADGRELTVMTPFHIDGVTKISAERAPSVGQHNEAVLREAGYTADDVERLRGLGVVA
ncbi:MAG: L-carnitine dehydratase/bile acid-inducible protein [Rhodopila sp.]|jgi:crotonobetainyl-CoA:carnitine CoA-transferase CaiB-like acyl-CoA transferase|nr:L-carnitine dehydratase/bile acid-inducible protein [Rhodopila sp.]